MNRALLVAVLLAAPALSGCLSVSALFNSKTIFKKHERDAITGLAGLADLFVVAPAVGAAGYYGIEANDDRRWVRDGFMESYFSFGWELLRIADALCAVALKRWIWDEELTDDLDWLGSRDADGGVPGWFEGGKG